MCLSLFNVQFTQKTKAKEQHQNIEKLFLNFGIKNHLFSSKIVLLGLKYIPRQVSTKDSISLLYPCLSKLLNARVTHFNKMSPAIKGFNKYIYKRNSRTLRIKYVYQTFQPQGNATLQSSNSSLLRDGITTRKIQFISFTKS